MRIFRSDKSALHVLVLEAFKGTHIVFGSFTWYNRLNGKNVWIEIFANKSLFSFPTQYTGLKINWENGKNVLKK